MAWTYPCGQLYQGSNYKIFNYKASSYKISYQPSEPAREPCCWDWSNRFHTIRLTEGHNRQVTTGQVLSDNHINAAQTPLSHQVPELSGFQLINYSWNYDKVHVASNNSIQLHHTDAFHWAVSNFIQRPRSCYGWILDSTWRPLTCHMGRLPDFLGCKTFLLHQDLKIRDPRA